MSSESVPQTVEEYKKAQEAEWGQYVAAEAIDIGNARAFNPGDAVPVSHVKRGVVDKSQVKTVAKAEADEAKTEKKA